MTTQIKNFEHYSNQSHPLHPYLAKEKEIRAQCEKAIAELKVELLKAVKVLADKKTHSPVEAKVAANALITEKLGKIIDEMKKNTTDIERKKLIKDISKVKSSELYSPFEFKKILENILKGKSSSEKALLSLNSQKT